MTDAIDTMMGIIWESLEPVRGMINGTMRLSKTGRVNWSEDVQEKMGNPALVDFVVDRKNRLIGVRPSDTGAFRVTNHKGVKAFGFEAGNTIKRNVPTLSLSKAVARAVANKGGVWYIHLTEWKE